MSWQCAGCRTVHPDGVPACPRCEEGEAVKVNRSGATVHVGEGVAMPTDLPAGVRFVGPGAGEVTDEPVAVADAAAEVPEASESADYSALSVAELRDLAKERGINVTASGYGSGYAPKPELVSRLAAWDERHAAA